nr:RNA polymerase II-associated protein 3-like [Onthophagus taurus]
MDTILVQNQVRQNAKDLQDFYKELNQWGEAIKKKDEFEKGKPQRRQVSTSQLISNEKKFNDEVEQLSSPSTSNSHQKIFKDPTIKKHKRIKGSDYAAWDKFDADAYCAKLDKIERGEELSDPETDEEEEVNERLLQLGDVHKEKGNSYVKQGNWDEGIRCYTEAIDCYAYNAIYYANRALCYLKKRQYKLAETDCTVALQIDKMYVKAYLRRAAAREGLKLFEDAGKDLLKVFEFEPYNTEAQLILKRVETALGVKITKDTLKKDVEKKKSILTEVIERKEPQKVLNKETKHEKMDVTENKVTVENVFAYGPGGNNVKHIEAVRKTPMTRSKRSLKRVRIENVNLKSEQTLLFKEQVLKSTNKDMEPITTPPVLSSNHNLLDFKIEKESEILKDLTLKDSPVKDTKLNAIELPTTSLQFYQIWNSFSDSTEKYKFLKKIDPLWLRDIFKYNMECAVFGEILEVLNDHFVPNNENYYEYLMGLTKVNRFSALVMFMTSKDTQSLHSLVEAMEKNNKYTKDDVLYVKTAYELKN